MRELLLTGLHLLRQQRFRWQPSLNASGTQNQDIKAAEQFVVSLCIVQSKS